MQTACSAVISLSFKMQIQLPPHRLPSRGPETAFWRRLPSDTAGPLTPDWQMALWGFSKACDGPSLFPAKEPREINIVMLDGGMWKVFTNNKLL